MKKMTHNTILTHTVTVTATDGTCKALMVATASDFVTYTNYSSCCILFI